ncbi:MAG: class I SAM-dependent methyltransferase [Chloroflexi bacterium]|nr:class I SAM-dependent methyltransferase [Chloroflexota bacterium]MCI0576053.1 class I SAM-dependent methyltransferase [Chloroflexota bacterium]MCI0647841.1 class I SAM-dependent methyltransferase [Chloroflexota bacterium]MCI0727092.1 class I SAM-dependent methyltransferase [Chloroflexota bacterium]
MKQSAIETLPSLRQEVIKAELAWHEQESYRRHSLDAFLYDPPAFDVVVESSLAFLEPAPGERVLDLGCGEGKETLTLASRGLLVIGVDLSQLQLSRARQLICEQFPGARVHFVQANAEELPFKDGAFRVIYGKAILHHLDIEGSAQEIGRLLPPGGRATFAEPMKRHPLFWLARRLTPRLRTKDEHPLDPGEFNRFGRYFTSSQTHSFFLLAPLAYPFRLLPGGEPLFRIVQRLLHQADTWLFRLLPSLKKIAWYGAVHVEK